MKEIKFRAFQKSTQKMLPVNSLKAICTTSERLTEAEFDDLIITQSTGLCDKNGKEIFEGDYIRIYNEYFEDGFVSRDKDGSWFIEGKNNCDRIAYIIRDYIEIIGNIYENPELLNK